MPDAPISPAKARADADWDTRGGDVVNAEIDARWEALPMDEVRAQFGSLPGQLRGYLTVVPESRWLKHPDNQRFFFDETTAHYGRSGSNPYQIESGASFRMALDFANWDNSRWSNVPDQGKPAPGSRTAPLLYSLERIASEVISATRLVPGPTARVD